MVLWTALLVMFCLPLAVGAQNQKMDKGSDTKTKKYYKPGSAWTLDTQLGIRQPNTMDTLMYLSLIHI